jgi:citrate synthase
MQSINMNAAIMKWLTAEQALKFLGVRAQTLYANVSRGKIRAKPDPDDSRRSLYSGADVARLAGRRSGRRSADTVAAQTIGWGDPILASAISTVADGRLWYRGVDTVELSERATLEEVAAILWQAQTAPRRTGPPPMRSTKSNLATPPLKHLLIAVSQRAASDPPLLGRSPAILKSEAQVLFDTLLAAALGAVALVPIFQRMRASPRRGASRERRIFYVGPLSCSPTTSSMLRPSLCASPHRPARRCRRACWRVSRH